MLELKCGSMGCVLQVLSVEDSVSVALWWDAPRLLDQLEGINMIHIRRIQYKSISLSD